MRFDLFALPAFLALPFVFDAFFARFFGAAFLAVFFAASFLAPLDFRAPKAGTYYVAVRVTSQRGDLNSAYGQVRNIDRIRIVVQ